MKRIKNLFVFFLGVALVMGLCVYGVSAATEEFDKEEFEKWMAEMDAFLEMDEEERMENDMEKLYSANIPDDFFLVPKEKMLIEGWDWDFSFLHDRINKGELSWDMFEPMYAYIAIVVEHDYLETKEINKDEFEFLYFPEDLEKMKDYYSLAIIHDQLSDNLVETYSDYNAEDFKGDVELTECVMRAIYTFCITAGVNPADFWSGRDFETFYGLSPEKITFSDEQLHYFDD